MTSIRPLTSVDDIFKPFFEGPVGEGGLPAGIYITRPIVGNSSARRIEDLFRPEDDPTGKRAMREGGKYYTEGMSFGDPADAQKRIDCFRAAELLYRFAERTGLIEAFTCLGYVYSYDRCEGMYWRGVDCFGMEAELPAYPREERACECYRVAAEAGDAESMYKYGDMLLHGRGCEKDAESAFMWFKRAYLDGQDWPVVWGSAALRMATCYEEGEGADASPEQALRWYKQAEIGLDLAVREGESWYRGAWRGAKAGIERMRQELSGEY